MHILFLISFIGNYMKAKLTFSSFVMEMDYRLSTKYFLYQGLVMQKSGTLLSPPILRNGIDIRCILVSLSSLHHFVSLKNI